MKEPLIFKSTGDCERCFVKWIAVIMKGSAVGPTMSSGFFEIQYTYTYLLRISDLGLTQWKWKVGEDYKDEIHTIISKLNDEELTEMYYEVENEKTKRFGSGHWKNDQ